MVIPEKYVDALYEELRSKDIRLLWSGLRDALEAVDHLCKQCGNDPEECWCEVSPCPDYPAPCNCINPETHDKDMD